MFKQYQQHSYLIKAEKLYIKFKVKKNGTVPNLLLFSDPLLISYSYSDVVGSIVLVIALILFAGNPPSLACSLINSSFGAM